jgi:hypothetical protein
MSGRSWWGWAGAPSDPRGGRGNGTRTQSAHGRDGLGRPLKKARTEGRTIVFVDESGLSQQPHRCRTWAPRGQTPVLEYNFNWKTLSVVAGLTVLNFYFRLYAGSVKGP